MISPTLHDRLAKVSRQAVLTWLTMLASLPLYAAIAWLTASRRPAAPTPPAFLLPTLALLAIAELVGASLFRRASFSDAALGRAPAAPPTFPIPTDLPPRDRQLYAVLGYARSRLIIVWAFCVGVGFYGLICVLAGHPAAFMLPFVAVALAALALHRPRLMELAERADMLLSRP